MYEDKMLVCRECETEFVFSAGEQDFFVKHGLLNTPTRCPACREKRRQAMASERVGGERRPRELHTIVCAECGAEDQVPFHPHNDKPVYCSECFERVRR